MVVIENHVLAKGWTEQQQPEQFRKKASRESVYFHLIKHIISIDRHTLAEAIEIPVWVRTTKYLTGAAES